MCFNGFQPQAVIKIPVETRRYLWSWVGSVNGKPDRGRMLDAIEDHPRWSELRERGLLQQLGSWDNSVSAGPATYRAVLYETQYAPCHRGTHPETFRLWEALEAGAIPVLVRDPAQAVIEALDLGVVWLDRWDQLPDFLLTAAPAATAARGAASASRFSALRKALSAHLTGHLCDLARPTEPEPERS